MTNPAHIPDDNLDDALAAVPPGEAAILREIWDLTAQADDKLDIAKESVDSMWESIAAIIHGRTDRLPVPPASINAKSLGRVLPWRRATATLAAALATGAIILFYWLRPVVLEALPGERRLVTLPDASSVELDSGSSITFARSFGDERAITLNGEAYFEVTHDARPFTVYTHDATIEVLGTSFNVRSWGQSLAPHTTVALAAGRIRLVLRQNPAIEAILNPGEIWRVGSDSLFRVNGADINAVRFASAWRSGDLYYINQPLGIILEDIERRYATDIQILIPDYQTSIITFSLSAAPDLETVLENLCTALNVRYRSTASGYEIYRD